MGKREKQPVCLDEGGWYTDIEDDEDIERVPGSDRHTLRHSQFVDGQNMKNFEMKPCLRFPNVDVYKKAFKDWSVRHGYEFEYLKNERKRVTIVCAHDNYNCRIHAFIVQGGSTFMVKTIKDEHACSRPRQNKHATSRYLSERCYLKLYDSPSKTSAEEDEEMSKLPPSQEKKLRQKQRKAEARAEKEAELKEESNATALSRSGKRHVKPVDLDPNGEKLLQVEDPLVEATKYLKLLQKHSSDSLETHLLSFEVNMRKQKALLAPRMKFFHKVGSMRTPVIDAKLIWAVLEAECSTSSQLPGQMSH